MRATKQIPANYHLDKTLNLSSTRAAIWLNVAAVPLLFLFGWLFSLIIHYLRILNPSAAGVWGLFNAFTGWGILALIASLVLMLTFHELIHGACFWLFTSERPKFALRPGYAYASAPEWCLPRGQYVIVGLAPFAVISVLSILIATFTPAPIVPYFIYIATFNAAGALGDMIVVAWVLRQSSAVLVQDQGDKFTTFASNE